MSDDEFDIFITSEKVARSVYKKLVVSNTKNEGVDYIFEFNGINLYYSDFKMPVYYKVYELLKEQYDTDILELKFNDEKEKQKVINYINYITADKGIDNSINI